VIDDGVIKFKLTMRLGEPPRLDEVLPLERWRAILWRLRLIGEYPTDRVGYGNISARLPNSRGLFLISGTQTGRHAHLRREQYTRVQECDLSRGSVTATGAIGPSSESLTHHAIYLAHSEIAAVFHIHHRGLWEALIASDAPAVSAGIPYGTTEMAAAARELIGQSSEGFFVMKGHQDGIVSYGPSAEVAGKTILKLYRELGPQEVL